MLASFTLVPEPHTRWSFRASRPGHSSCMEWEQAKELEQHLLPPVGNPSQRSIRPAHPQLDAHGFGSTNASWGQGPVPGSTEDGLGGGGSDGEEEEEERRERLEHALRCADAASRKASLLQMAGLALYALSTVFGTLMSLGAKLLGQRDIGVFEVVLFRSFFLLALTGPELAWRRVNPFGDRIRRWLYLLRGILGYFSVSSLYMAVSLLPMGDAAVLSFLSPLFVAALSPCLLRERPSKGLLLAIPFCMAGVILVSKPSFIFGSKDGAISGLGVSVGIIQAVFNAAARIAVRALSLGNSEPLAAILFSMGAVSSICAAITLTALRKFVLPKGPWEYGLLLANGLAGYLYQVTLTAGLQRVDAAPAVAMSYLGVIWGMAADVLIFSTPPTPLSLAGVAVISASSFFVAYGERRRQMRAKAALRWEASQERLARAGPSDGYSTDSAPTDLVLLLPSATPSMRSDLLGEALAECLAEQEAEHGALHGTQQRAQQGEEQGRVASMGLPGYSERGGSGGGSTGSAGASGSAVVEVWEAGEGEEISTPAGRRHLVVMASVGAGGVEGERQ